MSVVGRFEILSPIFSGALDTSTARDPGSGDTVLLHLLPSGHADAPRDLFMKIASDWPGQVLDSGVDPETQRPFVVTEYPKDRKAFRLLIHELGRLKVPTDATEPSAAPEPATPAPIAAPPPPAPAPESDPALDLLAFFKAQTEAAAKPAAKPAVSVPENPAGGGATRLFDPSAVFGPAAVAASAAAASPERPKSAPVQDGATRMFDPSAVFGAAAPAPQPAPAPANDGSTRMFDPSAVFGNTAPVAPKPVAPPPVAPPNDSATRMFDPSAVFGAAPPPPKPAAPASPPSRELTDSAKRAAEAFISGKLPEEFRNAPRNVQRSLEELLGRKPEEPDVQPTPGRPGVITLMFDAYGKRIEQAETSESGPPPEKPSPASTHDGSTKIISSADLSAMFASQAGAQSAEADGSKDKKPSPPIPKDQR